MLDEEDGEIVFALGEIDVLDIEEVTSLVQSSSQVESTGDLAAAVLLEREEVDDNGFVDGNGSAFFVVDVEEVDVADGQPQASSSSSFSFTLVLWTATILLLFLRMDVVPGLAEEEVVVAEENDEEEDGEVDDQEVEFSKGGDAADDFLLLLFNENESLLCGKGEVDFSLGERTEWSVPS